MDGLQNSGEYGIGGVQVDLWKNGQKIASTVSAPSGYYAFNNVESGTYTVSVALPSGGANSILAGAIPTIVSNVPKFVTSRGILQPGGQTSSAEVIITDKDDLTMDFAFSYLPQEPFIYGDNVWDDTDGDGVQSDGEPGIPGVLVELVEKTTGIVLDSTITDAWGKYNFGISRNGYHIARIPISSDVNPHLSSFIPSPLSDGSKGVLLVDVKTLPPQLSVVANFVALGKNDPTLDFGLMEPAVHFALPQTSSVATLLSQSLSQLDIFLSEYSLSVVSVNNVTVVDQNTVTWTITLNSVGTTSYTPQMICKHLRGAITSAANLPSNILVTGCSFNSLRKRFSSSTFVISGYIWFAPGYRNSPPPQPSIPAELSIPEPKTPETPATPSTPTIPSTPTKPPVANISSGQSIEVPVKKNDGARQGGILSILTILLLFALLINAKN